MDNEMMDMINQFISQGEVKDFLSDIKKYDIFVILRACIMLEDVKNSYKSHLTFIFAQKSLKMEKFKYNKKDIGKNKPYIKYVSMLEKLYNKNNYNKHIVDKALDKICSDFVKFARAYYKDNNKVSSNVLSKLLETALYANIVENELIRNQL